MPKRVGVFGGSFNPIHNGHLILAEQVREIAGLDKVIFVPAHVNPFKVGREQPSGEDRMRMVELAIGDAPGMEVSDFEILRDGPSYTYDTLMHFREELPEDTEIYFILGSDTLIKLEDWKKGPELIENFGFISIYRKGESRKKVDQVCARLKAKYPTCNIRIFESPELEISSSDMRERLRFGQSIKFITPDPVIEYIESHGLYDSLTRRLGTFVRKNVKPSRFAHTIHVVRKAQELCERYGVSQEIREKVETAAIFHDAYRDEGNLSHGPLAAEHLETDWGITDPDILNAVRYHTTGHAEEGLTEIILKMADLLEETRTYAEVAKLRASITDDLYGSYLMIMERLKVHEEQSGHGCHPDTQACIDWLKNTAAVPKGGDHGK